MRTKPRKPQRRKRRSYMIDADEFETVEDRELSDWMAAAGDGK
jgi:hypothetical protein